MHSISEKWGPLIQLPQNEKLLPIKSFLSLCSINYISSNNELHWRLLTTHLARIISMHFCKRDFSLSSLINIRLMSAPDLRSCIYGGRKNGFEEALFSRFYWTLTFDWPSFLLHIIIFSLNSISLWEKYYIHSEDCLSNNQVERSEQQV